MAQTGNTGTIDTGDARVDVTDGYKHVATGPASTWSYGNWPNTLYVDAAGSAGTNDDDVIYTANDVSMYNTHYFEVTTGAITVDVSIDGTNWVADVAFRDIISTTPTTLVVTAAAGKIVELKGKYRKIRVLQDGVTASNARIAHTWS